MQSNRKYSIKHNIENQHNGKTLLVKFFDYLVGK